MFCTLTGNYIDSSPHNAVLPEYKDGCKVISRAGYAMLPEDMQRPVFLYKLVRLHTGSVPNWYIVGTSNVFIVELPLGNALVDDKELRTLFECPTTDVHYFRRGKYVMSFGPGGQYDALAAPKNPIQRMLDAYSVFNLEDSVRVVLGDRLLELMADAPSLIPAETLAAFFTDTNGVWVLTWDGHRAGHRAGLSNRVITFLINKRSCSVSHRYKL